MVSLRILIHMHISLGVRMFSLRSDIWTLCAQVIDGEQLCRVDLGRSGLDQAKLATLQVGSQAVDRVELEVSNVNCILMSEHALATKNVQDSGLLDGDVFLHLFNGEADLLLVVVVFYSKVLELLDEGISLLRRNIGIGIEREFHHLGDILLRQLSLDVSVHRALDD